MKKIVDKAWLVPMGNVNSVLLEGDDGKFVLIDAGFPGHEADVYAALETLGRRPEDLAHLVFTHAHPDHIGSAAAIVSRSGAQTWMHPADVPIAEAGGPFRPMTPSPGLIQKVLFRIFFKADETVAPVKIDHQFNDGETLPLAGGLNIISTPGHSAGHVSLLWQGTRLLIVGDVGSNMVGLAEPLGYEDRELGLASQRTLASLNFDAAAFGHGRAIPSNAMARFQKAWGAPAGARA